MIASLRKDHQKVLERAKVLLVEKKHLETEKAELEADLEIYRASKILEVVCKDKEKTRNFLKRHYASCMELNKTKFAAYFLTITFTKEATTGIFDLSDKNDFPNFLYLCIKSLVNSENFKLICRTYDADGNPGFGFKKIDDSWKWIGLNQIPTLYLINNQKYQQETFRDEINGYVTEIKFLGKK